jgi:FkbM family methyltransferase
MQRLAQFVERFRDARRLGGLDGARLLAVIYWERLRARLPWLPEGASIVRVEVGGVRVRARVRGNGADSTVFRGVFLDREYRVAELLPAAPSTILDVGANCGYAALFFAATFPGARIACVEPLPRNVAAFRENAAANQLDARLLEVAIATRDGEAELYLTGNDSCESLAPIHAWTARTTVPTRSVESVLSELGWARVDLLKLDIEGYERELLAGRPAWLDRVAAVVAELHGGYTAEQFGEDLGPDFTVAPLGQGYEKTWVALRRGAHAGPPARGAATRSSSA